MKKFLEFLMKKIQDNMKKMIAQNMASLEGGGRERAIWKQKGGRLTV